MLQSTAQDFHVKTGASMEEFQKNKSSNYNIHLTAQEQLRSNCDGLKNPAK